MFFLYILRRRRGNRKRRERRRQSKQLLVRNHILTFHWDCSMLTNINKGGTFFIRRGGVGGIRKIIGALLNLAIFLTIISVNDPPVVDKPSNPVGLTQSITSSN